MRSDTSRAHPSDMKKLRLTDRKRPSFLATLTALAVIGSCGATTAWAQNYPITPQQRATAQQTAQAGVPLSELSPKAPDEYTVKSGDTLWAISRLYLLRPWRWPELWGMNINEIANPHRIYPGQVLYLDKTGGRARLTMRRGGSAATAEPSSCHRAPVSTRWPAWRCPRSTRASSSPS